MPYSLSLWDCHCHTEFAYCGQDVAAAPAIAVARQFGLDGICLTEHAPQLYCTAEDFWDARHIREPDIWRSPAESRMADYRRAVEPLRSDFVRVGLEAELDEAGQLTVLDEDRRWLDLLLGAIHWLPHARRGTGTAEWNRLFLQTCETILAAGVDVLAHPFRLFMATDRPVSPELYTTLADMLAATGTAVELNFHYVSNPNRQFYLQCIQRGVKVAFGSDAHRMDEVARLEQHVAFLRQVAEQDDIAEFLFVPPQRGTADGNG